MAGWFFRDAELDEGELLIFRRVAVLRRRWRRIGGEVNVTDRRLLFVPNRLEHLVGVKPISVLRADVSEVHVVEPPPTALRLKGLPGVAQARAEIDTDDDEVGMLLLTLEDARGLAQVLGQDV